MKVTGVRISCYTNIKYVITNKRAGLGLKRVENWKGTIMMWSIQNLFMHVDPFGSAVVGGTVETIFQMYIFL